MNYKFSSQWGSFLSQQQWQIYGTATYYNSVSAAANRRIMVSAFNSLSEISTMFFVSEPFVERTAVHSHFLVMSYDPEATVKRLKKRFLKYGRHQIEMVDYSAVNLTDDGQLKVGYYVTKNLNYGVDYDILVK